MEKFRLTDKQLRYALDYNGASKGTGFCKNSTINPSIAHAITVRAAGGQQRSGVSNFVSVVLPMDFPVVKLKKLLWSSNEQR